MTKCTPCYLDQGICEKGKKVFKMGGKKLPERRQEFIDGLNDLAEKTRLHIIVVWKEENPIFLDDLEN